MAKRWLVVDKWHCVVVAAAVHCFLHVQRHPLAMALQQLRVLQWLLQNTHRHDKFRLPTAPKQLLVSMVPETVMLGQTTTMPRLPGFQAWKLPTTPKQLEEQRQQQPAATNAAQPPHHTLQRHAACCPQPDNVGST